MSEQEQWRQQFILLNSKDPVSNTFIFEAKALINMIRTRKRKKILQMKIPQKEMQIKKGKGMEDEIIKASNQLDIQMIEKSNLEKILDDQGKIISKYKMQNTFLEQELGFYKKDENVLKNITSLMGREVNVLNNKIGYYNKQIDQTWSSLIKKGCVKKPEPQIQEKKPVVSIRVQQQKKKPRVTFPQYFADPTFEQSSDTSSEQQKQQQPPLIKKRLSDLIIQPLVIVQPETPSLSKYQLKSILSCITSIHNLPSTTNTWSLTKQQISIYTKQKIMQYYNTSLPFPASSLYSLVMSKYNTLKESVQHLQQQYMLYQQTKKQLNQKIIHLQSSRYKNPLAIRLKTIDLSKQQYQSQVNTIILIIVSIQRLVNRYLGIIDSLITVIRRGKQFVIQQESSLFLRIKKGYEKIKEEYLNDDIANIINNNAKKQRKIGDRIRYLMLSNEERKNGDELQMERIRYVIKFYFKKYLEIQQLINNAKDQLKDVEKTVKVGKQQKRNLQTYYIETPDYYRMDNFRLLQKMEKKNRRNILVLSTARLERKGSSQQREQTVKTQIKTQRNIPNKTLFETTKTVRQFRSTVSTENRVRLQKTYSKALTLSNIVKKLGTINRPLSTFRLSK